MFNRKSIKVITAPAISPISLADMKSYLRVDTAADDTLIQDFIDSASEIIKQYIRRSLISETLELTMDSFSDRTNEADANLDRLGAGVHTASVPYVLGAGNEIDIPFLPIVSITSITTFNRSNTSAVFDNTKYELDETGGRIYLDEGETFPSDLRVREAIKILYVAGYGALTADIPKPIVQAIRLYVGAMYDSRSPCDILQPCKTMLSAYRLLDTLGY